MASSCNSDIWSWIHNLPPLTQWKQQSMSICLCSSHYSSLPSLNLSITRHPSSESLSFSIFTNFSLPISLWMSKPVSKQSQTHPELLDDEAMYSLIVNFVQDVLKYGPSKQFCPIRIPRLNASDLRDIFDKSFFTLFFMVCIYEAPRDLRSSCLIAIKDRLTSPTSREASKLLMRLLGSNMEEQWMRSLNLAITNWKTELRAASCGLRLPSPLFSYSFSTLGLWKVQLYCPLIAMENENSSGSGDEPLMFSLNFHQLESVIQLNHKVIIHEKWVDVMVKIDNIRLDVVRLVNETLLKERGAGVSEKHFPSRVTVQLTPIQQREILSVSVSKSSDNPTREIELEKSIEGSFDPPNSLGLKLSAAETMTTSLKPWKFEESVVGDSVGLNWFLHDSHDGREVFSARPSKLTLFQHKAWFKNRYASAYRPFTRQGGVVFAGDEYGESVWWKVDKSAVGKRMEWEIKGSIGLTYWPNKYRTSYYESKRAEFREMLQLSLV